MPFRSEDWSRLKSIATGNPDESKIGAFGCGFYSLFSVTESPLVESPGRWMSFYWKDGKDQVRTSVLLKKGRVIADRLLVLAVCALGTSIYRSSNIWIDVLQALDVFHDDTPIPRNPPFAAARAREIPRLKSDVPQLGTKGELSTFSLQLDSKVDI